MGRVEQDPIVVQGVAMAISAAADSGPSSAIIRDDVSTGSARVDAALEANATAFTTAWEKAVADSTALASNAIEAVEQYQSTDEDVAAAAKKIGCQTVAGR